jgi:hypothetical protein
LAVALERGLAPTEIDRYIAEGRMMSVDDVIERLRTLESASGTGRVNARP